MNCRRSAVARLAIAVCICWAASAGEGLLPGQSLLPGESHLARNSHPRLLFSPTDLPAVRARFADPAWAALRALLLERSPVRTAELAGDRRWSWLALNCAALYLISNQPADRAAALDWFARTAAVDLPPDRPLLHLAQRQVGLALAYDLLATDFEPGLAAACAEHLKLNARGLAAREHRALPVPAPPVPAEDAICAAALLLSGLVLDPSNDSETAAWREAGLAGVKTWLSQANARSGFACNGEADQQVVLSAGVLAAIRAAKLNLGAELIGEICPGLFQGKIIAADPGPIANAGLSSLSVQASGRSALLLGCVPADQRPVLSWVLDHSSGAHGKGHFDSAWPWQALAAAATLPDQVPSADPRPALPLHLADPEAGHVVLRSGWGDDAVVVQTWFACRGASADPAAPAPGWLRLASGGKRFELVSGMLGKSLAGMDQMTADFPRPGQAKLAARLDSRATPASGRRLVGIDLTGAAGCPAVVVLVDRLSGSEAIQRWDAGIPRPAWTSANTASLGDEGGLRLTARLAAPQANRGSVPRPGTVVLVLALHTGAPPEIAVSADPGGGGRIVVGDQTAIWTADSLDFSR